MYYLDHGDLYPKYNDGPELMAKAILLGAPTFDKKNPGMFKK